MTNLLRFSVLGLAATLAACAPRFYERSTVTLDGRDDGALQVRYGELDGCLFRHQLPVEYTLRRPAYTLVLRPVAVTGDGSPRVELRLQTDRGVELRVDNAREPVAPLYIDGGSRYLVDTAALAGGRLELTLSRGAETVGTESFAVSRDRCRVLATGP